MEINTVLNCQCEISPIIRFINFRVMEGANTVFLDEYKDSLLNSSKLIKLNDCLKKHGFEGKVKFVDGFCIYGC